MGTKRKHDSQSITQSINNQSSDEMEMDAPFVPIELNLAELRAEFAQDDDEVYEDGQPDSQPIHQATHQSISQSIDDDDYTSKKAFAVYGKPNWSISESVEEWTAEEYMKRVKFEAKKIPSIFTSSIDPRQYDSLVNQSINQTIVQYLPPTLPIALPSPEWQSRFISQFIEMRLALSNYQAIHPSEPLPVKGPSNNQPTKQSNKGLNDQSGNQTDKQSDDQSNNEHSDQTVNQSTTYYPHPRDLLGWLLHCTKQSRANNQSTKQTNNQSINETPDQNQPTDHPTGSSVNQSTNQPSDQSDLPLPHLHVINSFDQLTTRGLVDRMIDWFDNQTRSHREQSDNQSINQPHQSIDQTINLPDRPFTEWVYCLLVNLSKPLLINQSVEMRRLYRMCGEIRSKVSHMLDQSNNHPNDQSNNQSVDQSNSQSINQSKYAEIVMHCNMIMAIVSDVFGQSIPLNPNDQSNNQINKQSIQTSSK